MVILVMNFVEGKEISQIVGYLEETYSSASSLYDIRNQDPKAYTVLVTLAKLGANFSEDIKRLLKNKHCLSYPRMFRVFSDLELVTLAEGYGAEQLKERDRLFYELLGRKDLLNKGRFLSLGSMEGLYG